MLTRTTWLMGGLAIVALAAASTVAAEEHRDKDSVARFLAAPSCEISSHDSDDHFRTAHGGVGGNLLGGSYGEIFFANGAGARAAAASSTSGDPSGSSAGGGSNSGAPSSGNGGSATNAPGTTGPQTPGLTTATSKASVKADPVPGGTGGGVVTKGDPVAGNPEPASLLLLGTGLGSVLIARRRQGRRDRD